MFRKYRKAAVLASINVSKHIINDRVWEVNEGGTNNSKNKRIMIKRFRLGLISLSLFTRMLNTAYARNSILDWLNQAATNKAAPEQIETIAVDKLPAMAQDTLRIIAANGPYSFEKDGTPFFNREKILPDQKKGYYREYTVAREGAKSRGAKRIVCGGSDETQRQLLDCYYTKDHYNSFNKIVATE